MPETANQLKRFPLKWLTMRRALVLAFLLGCGGREPETVVVYVSLDRMFSEPILREFEKRTGIRVDLVTDAEHNKTTGLVERLMLEKNRPVADVFWNSEIVRTILLKRRGVLERYPTDGPMRDPDGTWTGFAARARIILVNTNLVKEPPRSLDDFARPEWKGRCALANPLFGTTGTQIAAIYAESPDRAEKLLRALKANEVKIVDGNSMARNDVMDGRLAACYTDTDDANEAMLDGKPVRMIVPDPALLIPNTVALIRGSPHAANGRKLIDYLVSREVEAALAKSKSAQIPLRPGVEPFGPEFDLSKIRPAAVDFEKIADAMEASARLVQEILNR